MVGKRVLVVDDDPVTSGFVASLLVKEGYDVLVATSGEQAVELAQEHRFDLILGELAMPYRDGRSVVVALAELDTAACVPLIILSTRDKEDDVVRGLEQGADDYVVQPYNARELLARVRKQLDRPKVAR